METFGENAAERRSTKEASTVTAGTVDDFRTSSRALATLVGGSWESLPNESWVLQRMNRMSSVTGGGSRKAIPDGTLLYAGNPQKFIGRLNRAVRGSRSLVLMVAEDAGTIETDIPVLRVPNVTGAANSIARAFRDDFRSPIIAVTGSMGKTTVKTMISHILSIDHNVFTSASDFNGIASLRSRILALDNEEYAIFEVPRAVLPGAQNALAPNICIITAIAEAHMEALGSLENTARIKASLLEGLSVDGTAIINIDAIHSDVLISTAYEYTNNVITYGESREADLTLIGYSPRERGVHADIYGESVQYHLSLSGKHNALNSLAVIAALISLNLDPREYLKSFSGFQAVAGRGRASKAPGLGNHVTVVDQTFNANPISVRAAIEDFSEQYRGLHQILVLGDMLELGPSSGDLHEDLVPAVLKCSPDKVYLVGPQMGRVWDKVPAEMKGAHVMKAEHLIHIVPSEIDENSAVLMKGSHGTNLNVLVDSWCAESSSHDR